MVVHYIPRVEHIDVCAEPRTLGGKGDRAVELEGKAARRTALPEAVIIHFKLIKFYC